MQGKFTCRNCRVPKGGHRPSGTVETTTLDAESLLSTDFGFSGGWMNLTPLGKPVLLPAPPAGVGFWGVPTGPTVTSFYGRWSAGDAVMTLVDIGGGQSIITWANGRDFIKFTLNSARYGQVGVLPSVASGVVDRDNVGILDSPGDFSEIVLEAGPGGLRVSTSTPALVSVPGPFER